MIQGASLIAGLADCGGVSDNIGPTETMNSYVILSRLTSAEGLLLLRAFSPYLFTMNTAFGPLCLLKFLRSRFEQDDSCITLEKMRAEYERMMEDLEYKKLKRKQDGLLFVCWYCESLLPSECFGADRDKPNEIYSLCIGPGYWKECIICEKTLIRYRSQTPRNEEKKNVLFM